MTVINTNGMTIIGPGSEWFWAALSGIVTMVTLLAIWRQLRLQASQAAIEQVDAVMRDFFSERMLGHQLALLLALQAGVDRAQLPDGSATAIVNYFGKLGQLAKAGHVDLKNIGGMALVGLAWWATLEPYTRRMRTTFGASTASEQHPFEWLAGKFAEISERAGYDRHVRRDLPSGLTRASTGHHPGHAPGRAVPANGDHRLARGFDCPIRASRGSVWWLRRPTRRHGPEDLRSSSRSARPWAKPLPCAASRPCRWRGCASPGRG